MTTYEMTPEQYEKFCKTINPSMLTGYAIMDDLMAHRDIEGSYSKQYLTPIAPLKGGVPGVGFSALQKGATGTVSAYTDNYGRPTKYVLETTDKTLEKAAKEAGAVQYEGANISEFKPGKGKYIDPNGPGMERFGKGGKYGELTPEEQEKMRGYIEKTIKKPSVIPDNPYGPSARVTEEKFEEIGKGLRDLAKKEPDKYGKIAKEFTNETNKLKPKNEFGTKMTEYQIPPKVLERMKQSGVLQKIAEEIGVKKEAKQK